MKYWPLTILLLIAGTKSIGQKITEANLIHTLNQYRYIDTLDYFTQKEKVKDSLWHIFTKKFERYIQNKDAANYKFKKLKKLEATTPFELTVSKSEDNNWLLYSFVNENRFYLNYLTKAIKTNNKISKYQIMLQDNKWNKHFTQIHNLNAAEILLIEQKDELVYACNYACVYAQTGSRLKKKNAFNNRTKLTVCNFTEWEGIPDSEHQNGLYFDAAKKISYTYKTKTIYYGTCIRQSDGKRTIGRAKYINGNFNIRNCDDRKFD